MREVKFVHHTCDRAVVVYDTVVEYLHMGYIEHVLVIRDEAQREGILEILRAELYYIEVS